MSWKKYSIKQTGPDKGKATEIPQAEDELVKPAAGLPKTVELTPDEEMTLLSAILSQYRSELESEKFWLELEPVTLPDGSPKFIHATGNAAYHRKAAAILKDLYATVSGVELEVILKLTDSEVTA